MIYLLDDYDKHLASIILTGEQKPNRTGVDTYSLFGLQGRYKIDTHFPIPTKRKYAYKSIFAELLWMLSGSTNIKDLEKMNSKIWSAWQDSSFEQKHSYSEGELGPIYGWQMRHSGGDYSLRNSNPGGVDQVGYLVEELKCNKFSRRILMNLWNPTDMLSDRVKLPCCHYSFQLLVDMQDRLTGILTQRSGDWLPGISANIVFYSALIYMLGQQCNLKPYQLIHNVADAHCYISQFPAAEEYLKREKINSPTLILHPAKDIFSYSLDNFEVKDYYPADPIKVPVAI
jgi:thymidylate synthase